MVNRLTKLSGRSNDENTLLLPYMVAGYPTLERSLEIFELFAEEGADIIEIGMPFSDPLADGVVIQTASTDALNNGTNLGDIFNLVRNFRKKYETPLILMGYYNPVLKRGIPKFFSECSDAGVDGVIIPDLSPEESDRFLDSAREHNISVIFLVAPNTTDERIRLISELSTEFIYCVALYGVTGTRASLPDSLQKYLKNVRQISGRKVLVGFGVSSAESARRLAPLADGIVIGSAFVKRAKEVENSLNSLRKFFREIRESLNG